MLEPIESTDHGCFKSEYDQMQEAHLAEIVSTLKRIWPLVKCEPLGREDFREICAECGVKWLFDDLSKEV